MNNRILVLTAGLLTIGVASANAQAAGAVVAPAAGGLIRQTAHREIPAVAARAIIAAHPPDVIDGSSDGALVSIVLDANNNYVTSTVSKPTIVVHDSSGGTAAVGGFVARAT